MKKKNGNDENGFSAFFKGLGSYIRKNYQFMLLVVVGYAAASALNFMNVATSQTIATYSMDDFEVGQIADRTIYASRSIPADDMNPVFVEDGEKIIRKGFPITEEAYQKLQKMSESPLYMDYRAFANSELFLLLIVVAWFLFFAFLPRKRRPLLREYIFQAICFLVVYAAVAFGVKNPIFSATPFALAIIIPASLFVLIESILFGQLNSLCFSIILSLGVLDACSFQIVPFLFTLAMCLASSMIVRRIERRIDMVLVAIVQAFVNVVIITLLGVIFNKFSQLPPILGGVAANGFLSGILALGFITPVEFLLNTASVFRMMDLSDLNNPVMRKMLVMASGTYQHSQMVAQLAENACRDIGADSLLARVGAYYHDIGKMDQSEYFVENQSNGVNKHNSMNPNLSVSVIRSHVRKGIEKAHQLHLPRPVINIIEEHHGNSLIAYFFEEAKKRDPNVNPADYSYTGNPPTSKESAVVMLADTVEAACRTLDNPTEERLDKFIQTLINYKVEHHQLDNCELTYSDVKKIKAAFVKLLVGYYHSRIEYPDQKNQSEGDAEQNSRSERLEKSDKDKVKKTTKKDVVLGEKTLSEAKLHG